MRRCPNCGFAFVENNDNDYTELYDEAYYRGQGADRLVDYEFELEHPDQTVRVWEWSGILKAVSQAVTIRPSTRWLDYGCGNGTLVRWLTQNEKLAAYGYDQGWIVRRAQSLGIAVFGDLTEIRTKGPYDVITAIEVLEHVENPRNVLSEISAMLAPGGVFFCTTGNLQKHRGPLADWGYVIPEVHISFYEPRTLGYLYAHSGMAQRPQHWSIGFEQIIRFKILKSRGIRRVHALHRLIPWKAGALAAERRFGISDFPLGIKI